MCGINGIALSSRSGRSVDESMLTRMRDVLHHRGPDDAGSFVEGPIGLGHRRLSIVDVSHGAQPMFNEDGSVVIVYNGEIYNHSDYRNELVAKGHVYRTHCDTETIVHLYEEYGTRCVEKLRGMFAFAIWNRKSKQLFIARDRFGVKPLYYIHDSSGNLFFGSEIKTFIAGGMLRPELNYNVLPDQMANPGTSGDETLFRSVKRLPPGHTLLWSDGKLTIHRYWDISFEPKLAWRSDAEAVESWLELFKEAVKLRLMADVPLGMFLSGGIDSSAIAAVMSKMVNAPIKTFSVGFAERAANEFEYARIVSRAFGTEHHEVTITPDKFFSELPKMIWHEDEPLGFVASVPLYFVSKLAQQHVKVVLTGEGSDEILAGYGRYRTAINLLRYGNLYERIIPRNVRSLVKRAVRRAPMQAKLSRTFLSRDSNLESLYFNNFSIFNSDLQTRLFSDETKSRIAETNPYAILRRIVRQSDATNVLDQILYADSKTYLHELLMKQDQMSMAASIESRVPFLDHKLVEFTARMPVNMKLRGKTTKFLLRKAMQGILPAEILSRPKMGFPVPVGTWFRTSHKHLIQEYLLSERAAARGIFAPDAIRELVAKHMAGANCDLQLYSLLNLEIWNRQFIDGESPSAL